MKCIYTVFGLLVINLLSYGQETPYEAKVIDTDRLNVEYMDFGGDGLPLIVVQGVHNYFDKSSTNKFIQYSNESWIQFYSMFTEDNHVLAPLKRGFGKTDAQLENESIESASEDLLSWMNKLGIEKAYFIGRDNSAQTMLHFAEHYPERVIGLIFIQPIFVFTEVRDEMTQEYLYYDNTQGFSASEYEKFKWKLYEAYRPQIFTNENLRLDVPALLFDFPPFSDETIEMRRISNFIEWVESSDKIDFKEEYSSPEIAKYFEELAKDEERMYRIKEYLFDNNPMPKMNTALQRSFGNKLVKFNESLQKTRDTKKRLLSVYLPVSKTFISMTNDN